MAETTQSTSDVDILLDAGWVGSSSPIRDAMLRLYRMDETKSGMGFVAAVLDLWLKSESMRLGLKTGGSKSIDYIVNPVILWWVGDEDELSVDSKYLPAANALVAKMEEVSWDVTKDVRHANRLTSKP